MPCPYEDAKKLLTNPLFLSDRSYFQFTSFDEKGMALPKMKAFYRGWLMFMDGEEHKANRRHFLSVLSKHNSLKNSRAIQTFKDMIKDQGIGPDEIGQCVKIWHQEFLGLSEEQQKSVFVIAKPILDFLFYDVLPDNDPEKLEQQVQKLHDWLEKSQFEKGSFMCDMLEANIPHGLILNVIIDSYEPVLAATTSVVANAQSFIDHPENSYIQRVLMENPPFAFINRHDNINRKFTTIDLEQVNAYCPDPKSHLSFGFGVHACPGAKVSVTFLQEIVSILKQEHETNELDIQLGQRENKNGLCRYSDFKISRHQRPVI